MDNELFLKHHSYAENIEHMMFEVFNCERFGLGGIVNADYIDKNPFSALTCTLATYYNNSEEKKKMIDEFIDRYYYYNDKSIRDIGQKEMDNIIMEFSQLLKDLK